MLTADSSQKADHRPISFLLDDTERGVLQTFDMIIRPEELTRTEPSRLSVQQTLGGVWADNFGTGVQNITIQGHTGWRGDPNGFDDGIQLFKKLNDTVFVQWHSLRQQAVEQGRNPASVQLLFSDALDEFNWEVAASSFTLRRSKSRPLLMQYTINMTVLNADADRDFGLIDLLSDVVNDPVAGLDSLSASINSMNRLAGQISGFVDSTLGSAVNNFVGVTSGVLNKVLAVAGAANGIVDSTFGSLIRVAGGLTQAGRNIFHTFAAVVGIGQNFKSLFMQMAGEFNNALCVLKNAFKARLVYPSYDSIYGSSNCSSTAGGRPLSQYALTNTNTFSDVSPAPNQAVKQSSEASSATQTLARMDPILAPASMTTIKGMMSAIHAGTVIEA